ncbi:MAG: formylglycine-generating enzyme family protein [Alkalinema sp. RU_4_3]|nr:formylglycine-generating enzyme family protein [Alkalinema sp. RU_4_3]
MPDKTATPSRRLVISRQTHQGQYFRELLDPATPLDMVLIPSGTFMMGQTEAEKEELIRLRGETEYQEYFTDELPRHEVTVQSFFIGKYPITQAQWLVVAGYPKIEQELDPDPSNFKGSNRPVEEVSWDDAIEFCGRLSQHTGRTYRLPSEAEWDYACRAGTTTPFHFGETLSDKLANYCPQDEEIGGTLYKGVYGRGIEGTYREETMDVGKFPANQFGLYDMHGNVWEWCEDDWHSNYKGAPADGSAWVENDRKSSNRLLRGGSWLNLPEYCRSSVRFDNARDSRNYNLGFRVSCVLPRILLNSSSP